MRRWTAVLCGWFLFSVLFSSLPIFPKDEPSPLPDDVKILAGNWTGHGAGEEVRYRHPNGLLTLTVKHRAEFVFHVDEKGVIEGEGTIEYDLEKNTSGLDDLVASVHALMNLAPTPAVVKGVPDKLQGSGKEKVAEGMGNQIRDVPGVTKIQYDAPHLKHGKEIRHFKFTGRIRHGMVEEGVDKGKTKVFIHFDPVTDFTLPDGKPDNTLIAEYEVNKVKQDSTFPCWSPFLQNPGIVRPGPGTIHIAEFTKKGKHRENKRVWQEYGYVWMARQIAPAQNQMEKKDN